MLRSADSTGRVFTGGTVGGRLVVLQENGKVWETRRCAAATLLVGTERGMLEEKTGEERMREMKRTDEN